MTRNIAEAGDARQERPRRRKLTDFAGLWADIPEKEWKEFETKVKEAKKGLGS
jgi:hypothetical protein